MDDGPRNVRTGNAARPLQPPTRVPSFLPSFPLSLPGVRSSSFTRETSTKNACITKPIIITRIAEKSSSILRVDKKKEKKKEKGRNEWKILARERGGGLYIYAKYSARCTRGPRSPCDLGENEISKIRYLNKAGVPRVRGKNEKDGWKRREGRDGGRKLDREKKRDARRRGTEGESGSNDFIKLIVKGNSLSLSCTPRSPIIRVCK